MTSSNTASKLTYTTSTNTASAITFSSVANPTKLIHAKSHNLASGENTSGTIIGSGFYGAGRYGGFTHFANITRGSISR